MSTREHLIYGLHEAFCFNADVTVRVAMDGSLHIVMYDGNQRDFEKWLQGNVPIGTYTTVEKADERADKYGISFVYDYTVPLGGTEFVTKVV